MSLYVVERENERYSYDSFVDRLRGGFGIASFTVPTVIDCNERDGEWYAFIRLSHEVVVWDGRAVPLFEGDVERREWEAARRRAPCPSARGGTLPPGSNLDQEVPHGERRAGDAQR